MSDPHFLSPPWSGRFGIEVYSTTRIGGNSAAPYDSFNLGLHVEDNEKTVRGNRDLLAKKLSFKQPPFWLHQVHGKRVVRAEDYAEPLRLKRSGEDVGVATAVRAPEADAACTSMRNQPLAVLTADCLPIVLATGAHDPYSIQQKSIAVVHAGWRGLAAGVLQNAIDSLNAKPGSIAAWMGPAIGSLHFEVGPEVREAFMRAIPDIADQCFLTPQERNVRWNEENGEIPGTHPDASAMSLDSQQMDEKGRDKAAMASGKWYADLYAIARGILQKNNITEISGGNNCSYRDQDLFYSYRRDGAKSGRMATLAVIRNN